MTREVFVQLAQEAYDELVSQHLYGAIEILRHLAAEVRDENLNNELTHIERSYTAMLDYLSTGGKDEGRIQMHQKMIQSAFVLLNALDSVYRVRHIDDYFSQCYSNSLSEVFEMLEELLTKGEMVENLTPQGYSPLSEQLFNTIVSDFCFNTRQAEMVLTMLQTEYANPFMQHLTQVVLSALTLSLWSHFDYRKLTILICARHHARALVGLATTLMRHEEAIRLWPEVEQALHEALDDPHTQEFLAQVNRELLMSAKSEELERKVKDELLPKIMDAVSDERVRLGFIADGDDEEEDDFERIMRQSKAAHDPNVEKKKKDLMQAAMQFMNLHEEGVDINVEMFVNAMRLPFFRKLSNWFQPYFPEHPEIESLTFPNGKPNVLFKLLQQSEKGDIDQYAFVLMLGQSIKSPAIQSVISTIEMTAKEAEAVRGGAYNSEPVSVKTQITSAVRTLYRFFTKSKWRTGTKNLFELPLNFLHNLYLSRIYAHNEKLLQQLGNVMAKYGAPSDALEYLKRYSAIEGASVETLQLMASCYEREGNYRQAAALLEQADVLSPDDSHTIGLLLACYTQLGMQERRLECLEQLERLMPSSAKITVETGLCLMKLERWKEAAQRFYKLELEDKKIVPSKRAIAWCSFKQKKYETALRYYESLINNGKSLRYEDFLNAAHTCWLRNETKRAIDLYLLFIARYVREAKEPKDLLAPFDKDRSELITHGVRAEDIDIMHDILMHKFAQNN